MSDNCFTAYEDITAHLNLEDEKVRTSEDDNISPRVVFRAIRDLFGDSIKTTNKTTNRKTKKVFLNLRKRCKAAVTCSSFEEEWKVLLSNIENICKEAGDGQWKVAVSSESSLSCSHFENVRCNSRVMITEVRFTKNCIEGKIDTMMLYDNRAVKPEVIARIEKQFCATGIIDKAKFLLTFMDNSYICCGFPASEIDGKVELYKVKVEKNLITPLTVNGTAEERYFVSECEVFTNSAGLICPKCQELKKSYKKKEKRQEAERVMDPKTNHRYMCREELEDKIKSEKKEKQAERRRREQIEAEMIQLEEEDDKDLREIMSGVQEKDIPEDMILFWEQQKQILNTKSSKGYRWHPK